MRRRHWTIFVALLAVLLHASFVAQHNAVVLAGKISQASQAEGFGVICHGSPDGSDSTTPSPVDPGQKSKWGFCPLCATPGSAAALPCEIDFDIARPVATSVRIAIHGEANLVRIITWRPPPRGPPPVV